MSDEHAVYLDELRESGQTNMFGARPYLMREFSELTKAEALSVLDFWMGDSEGREQRARHLTTLKPCAQAGLRSE